MGAKQHESPFQEIASLISTEIGIQLGLRQKTMVETRLSKRMSLLGFLNEIDYLNYFYNNRASETKILISILATHHSYFFRESAHFDLLRSKIIPEIILSARSRSQKGIKILSAACSRGQEAYSLAMIFESVFADLAPDLDFCVVGIDVDEESVQYAKNAVYHAKDVKNVPKEMFSRFLSRGTGSISEYIKVKDSLKNRCRFEVENLLNLTPAFKLRDFDIVFCRNVFIYFNPSQIEQISKNLLARLSHKGYFFVGISESLAGMGLPLEKLAASVFQKYQIGDTNKANSDMHFNFSDGICIAIYDSVKKVGDCFVLPKNELNREIINSKMNECLQKHHFNVESTKIKIIGSELCCIEFKQKRDELTIGLEEYIVRNSSICEVIFNNSTGRTQVSKETENIKNNIISMSNENDIDKLSAKLSLVQIKKKIKVLIVDDSSTIRKLLSDILKSDAEIELIGSIGNPCEVEAFVDNQRPDVITLDINMPGMDGIEVLRKIIPKHKIPTVMISSTGRDDGPKVLDALEAGAVDYIQKPAANTLDEVAALILERVKSASISKVFYETKKSIPVFSQKREKLNRNALVAMGASTGGTEALKEVLIRLPEFIPPIVVVQHIPAGFSLAFANRLNSLCPFEVKEAVHGDLVIPNRVLIAPGGKQMRIAKVRGVLQVLIDESPLRNRHRPSVDVLFESVASVVGRNSVGILLTGMGADGAEGMLQMRKMGSHTIAQDELSCVVYGMPREAAKLNAAEKILNLYKIPDELMRILGVQS